ncbi:MAG: hypothetical protein E7051_00240 [Lentisphaerae bacterium]|nr:hypothetical protein [Lentisphaerota bacterium]
MKIKKMFIFAVLFAVLAAMPLWAVDKMTFSHDRKLPVYKCGEKAVLALSAWEKGKLVSSGEYKVEFLFCGKKSIKTVPVDFSKGNPVKLECTLNEPGFVLMRVRDKNNGSFQVNKKTILAGAAFEPEKIRKSYDMPADFMAFWENNRRLLEKEELKLIENKKFSTDQYIAYNISLKSFNDHVISGYLTVPRKKGKYPAFVTVPGAGPGISSPSGYAKMNVITLAVNVLNFPTADNSAEQKARYIQYAKGVAYSHRGAGNRDTYFFRNVYSAIDRMINYVASLEEFDGKHMVIDGSSQGGGSALILAGLNKNITALAANVPALCDHGGYKAGRAPGWPNLASRPDVDKFAPYFDAANFASLIKVPAFVSCGFIDTTCSPSSVYAAFNELKGEKEMYHMPLEGHTVTGGYSRAKSAFVKKHLGI